MTSLKDRVKEDAERARLQKACAQASKLHGLLLAVGVVDDPKQGETKYDQHGNARFNYEGIRFTLGRVNSYDEESGEYGGLHDVLEASLLCTEEGCGQTLYWGQQRGVQRLGDLQQIFSHERGRCSRDHSRPLSDNDDSDLIDLPF